MKTYRTRISLSLVGFIIVALFAPVIFMPSEAKLVYASTMLLVLAGIILCMLGIKYVIDGKELKIYYFWGIHQTINIRSIRKMEPSHCMLSSPAASLKRLAIHYNKYDTIYISPRNQEDFINTVNEIIQTSANAEAKEPEWI